jgi:DnaJ-class molecular chaperone
MRFTDIFGSGAPAFGNLFERQFRLGAEGPRRGEDVHLNLAISLNEVLTGGNHAVTIRRPGPCPRCAGSGSGPGTAPRRCPGCGGTGQEGRELRPGCLLQSEHEVAASVHLEQANAGDAVSGLPWPRRGRRPVGRRRARSGLGP